MSKTGLAKLLAENKELLLFGDVDKPRTAYTSSILALDYIINGHGILGGSIVQLIGESGTGKTTIALDYLANAQKTGNLTEIEIPDGKSTRLVNAVFIDFEHSYTPDFAKMHGVDISKLLVIDPLYAENTFTLAEGLMLEGMQFFIIDSIGMLIAQSEEDKDYEDAEKVGAEAKALGRFLKRANALLSHNDGIMFVINHYRANLSPMARTEKKPYGARILKYVTKLMLRITQVSKKGNRADTEIFVEKSKLGETGLKVNFDLLSGKGIDVAGHILTMALEFGIVRKDGAWYKYKEQKAQGLENAALELPIVEIEPLVKEQLQKEFTQ